MKIVTITILMTAIISAFPAEARQIQAVYRNPALGYSIIIPAGLKGETGDPAGPERGFSIQISSGGEISVYGEPNSVEWKKPEEGVQLALSNEKGCARSEDGAISRAAVGNLVGAKGNLTCGNRLLEVMLVFRTGGEPIYWLCLKTNPQHRIQDERVFNTLVSSFRLIKWK